jgi:hypothetical protein
MGTGDAFNQKRTAMSQTPADRAIVLADRINVTWAKTNFDELSFSKIALDALHGSSFLSNIDASALIDWLAETARVPEQAKLDESFGQPSLTLYSDQRMHIDALFWHTAATGIHQHAFSGAFGVLEGSSMHCHYAFALKSDSDERIKIGRLNLQDWEILKRGEIREIKNGDEFIHSLFHLDAPTVSVVVRIKKNRTPSIEYVYHPPGFAIDPYPANEKVFKQLQMLGLLLRMRSHKLLAVSLKVLANSDLHTTLLVLLFLGTRGIAANVLNTLLEFTAERFGDSASDVVEAVEEQRRRQDILRLRSSVTDVRQRFLLAALLNFPDRCTICEAIRKRDPANDPVENIVDWLSQISRSSNIGIEFDEMLEALLKYSLVSQNRGELLKKMEARFPGIIENEIENIDAACEYFRTNSLLRPLFNKGNAQ